MLVSIFDESGPMTVMSSALAERDVERGILEPTDNPRVFRLVPAKVAAIDAIHAHARRVRKHGRFA